MHICTHFRGSDPFNLCPFSQPLIRAFHCCFFLQNNFPHQYIKSKKILSASIQPYIHLTDEQAKEAEDIFETILKEKQGNDTHKDELIALKIVELLILSERFYEEELQLETNLPVVDIIKRFIDLLEIHFTNERSVSFYASQLNMHPNHLNAVIKKHTGLTAKESIQSRLILETKYLLHSTNLSIKEISGKVGFDDPNYFTVFFRRLEKMSPGDYRSSFVWKSKMFICFSQYSLLQVPDLCTPFLAMIIICIIIFLYKSARALNILKLKNERQRRNKYV